MKRFLVLTLLAATLALPAVASAAVIPVGVATFGAGSTLTTFNGQANGADVNGLIVDGILFQYSLGNGIVVLNGGPGTTNNVSPLNVVSVGNNTGTLTLTLPGLANAFGYGFAVLSTVAVPAATTISLFDGATAVGSLSYPALPDPTFAGGFAGILSTVPFDRVNVTFNSAAAPAFAMDNIRTVNAVPEPTSLLLVATGGLGLVAALRRRKQRA